MTRPLVVLRPEPGNAATVARAGELGLDAHGVPLFATRPLDWTPPDPAPYVGVLLTSGNAVRFAGPALSQYLHLPAFAVGEATRRLAEEAGFSSVVAGDRDVSRLIARIATLGLQRLLHICGADVKPFDAMGIIVDRAVVYTADPVPPGSEFERLISSQPVVLVHSVRAGERLAALIPEARRGAACIVAISADAASAVGAGWEMVAIAPEPRDEAILQEAVRLCRS